MPFEKVNARGEKREGASSLTKGGSAFSLTKGGRAFAFSNGNNSGHAYTEAIANIRALKKAFPDAILNRLFPEQNKIVKEIEY